MSLCICDMCKSAEIGYINEPCESCGDYEKFEFDSERFESEIRADERRKVLDELTIYMLNSCKDVKCREDITIDNDFDFYASELLDIFEEFKKPFKGTK